MKFFKPACVLATLIIIMTFSACGGDDPTAEEVQLKKLSAKTWKIESVQVNGTDQTDLFDNMTLTITKGAFTSTNGGIVWPASGTWEFADSKGLTFVRGDNTMVVINELTASSLNLSLTWNETTYGSGKTKSISGDHIFTFN